MTSPNILKLLMEHIKETPNKRKLLDKPDALGYTPLFYAYQALVSVEEFTNIGSAHKLLIEAGATDDKVQALMGAALCNSAEVFSKVVEKSESSLTHKDNLGNSFLHYIVASQDKNLALAKINASKSSVQKVINAQNTYGLTALTSAIITGDVELVKTLLTIPGVDLNSKDIHGTTPLMYAVSQGQDDIINVLLEDKRVDINARNKYGCNAFEIAAFNISVENHVQHKQEDTWKIHNHALLGKLLEYGADPKHDADVNYTRKILTYLAIAGGIASVSIICCYCFPGITLIKGLMFLEAIPIGALLFKGASIYVSAASGQYIENKLLTLMQGVQVANIKNVCMIGNYHKDSKGIVAHGKSLKDIMIADTEGIKKIRSQDTRTKFFSYRA